MTDETEDTKPVMWFSKIRVTDKEVDEAGKKRTKDNPGGFTSFTGIVLVDVTEKSVGKKIETQDGPMTISQVWREAKAGGEATVSFKERDE